MESSTAPAAPSSTGSTTIADLMGLATERYGDQTAVKYQRGDDWVGLGTTTQGQFLAALGAGEILVGLQTGPSSDLQGYLEARSALVRMIDPAAMGGFRVMGFGRGLPDAHGLRGLG